MLVPLDGSPLAEVALSEARTLAMIPASEVILLQVIPPTEDVAGGGDDVGRAAGDARQVFHEGLRRFPHLVQAGCRAFEG